MVTITKETINYHNKFEHAAGGQQVRKPSPVAVKTTQTQKLSPFKHNYYLQLLLKCLCILYIVELMTFH